jgi:predicted flap endonuclease-1-like 5' DNA nuclease
MEELKGKYGITDDAIFEIADALEPDSEAPPEMPFKEKRGAYNQSYPFGGSSSALASAMRGDLSIAEAIILMDYQDRRDRRERWNQQPQGTSDIEKIIQEMREERKSFQDQMERLVLGRRADDAEDRAKRAEDELAANKDAQRQKEIVEGAVRGAVDIIGENYGSRLDELSRSVQQMNPQQQKGFFDELFSDFGNEIKQEFKDAVMTRLKGEPKPVATTDSEGKTKIDYGAAFDRVVTLGEKYIDTLRGKPPKIPVQEVPTTPGGATGPFPEGEPEPSEKQVEAEYKVVEEPPHTEEKKTEITPVPTTDIAGIGPARAKELSDMGITDAGSLSKLSPSYLADELSVSKEKAEDMIKQAKDLVEQQ